MAENVQPGNKLVLGTGPSANSSRERENTIIEKTKKLSFPMGAVIPYENFEHKGDRPEGWQNSIADMSMLSGKELQESYRAGFSESADYTDKVADR